MEFKRKILNTVMKNGLLKDGDHIILGLSGGPDSLALYNALRELREDNLKTRGKFGLDFKVHPVHINHKFRPGAAEEDQAYCEELCKKTSEEVDGFYPLKVYVTDCSALASELGMTSEEAGRKARYDAFRETAEEVRRESGLDKSDVKIAVAQNANDQAETVLFRILRGTGPDGLSGIAIRRDDESGFEIIRPILEIKRDEIERYCEEKGLEPRRDHTNEEAVYSRNKIRLELLPYLEKEYNPNIVDTLNRLGRLSGTDKEHMYNEAVRAYRKALTGENSLDIKELEKLDPAIRSRVYMLALSDLGMRENMTEKHLNAIESVRTSRNHSMAYTELTGGFRAARKKGELIFCKKDEN